MDHESIQDYIESHENLDHQDTDPETYRLCGGMTLLHYAAAAGDIKTIRLLTSAGANPNLQRHDGWTPIHHAIDLDFVVATQDGHLPNTLPTTEILLLRGASDQISDNDGKLPTDLIKHFPETVSVYEALKKSVDERLSQG